MSIWKVILRKYVITNVIMSYPEGIQQTWIVTTFGGYTHKELVDQWNDAIHSICLKIGGQPEGTTFDAERLHMDARGICQV